VTYFFYFLLQTVVNARQTNTTRQEQMTSWALWILCVINWYISSIILYRKKTVISLKNKPKYTIQSELVML